ncbi:MAG: CDP-diacylglycerol--glycerol-3-phosphate 3-phosphatidyltransferase [Pseudomonadota bacterium]|nr:CDP-diacylglycerol--glycerol-3-phosphate 3-phosphatidyltransferase [Pseudomonadota bacterium]MDE3038055.1 CDP-diacylglycerol--glycerol-3-phosphate 3-phosphatidyltransferase [Pseudomonadota bacterium]
MHLRKNLPNYLTYFRIAVIPALIVVYLWGHYVLKSELSACLSAALFALAGITDWLDGYAARLWKAESNIGRFLDPIADKLLVATALLLLVSDGRADLLPAIAIVCREILVSGLREFLAEIRIGVPVSKLAKFKTAAQMAAIFFLLLGTPAWLFFLGRLLLWIAAGLTLVTGYAYLKTGLRHMARDAADR